VNDVALVTLVTTILGSMSTALVFLFKALSALQAQRYDSVVAQMAAAAIAQKDVIGKLEAEIVRLNERLETTEQRAQIWEQNSFQLAKTAARSTDQLDLLTTRLIPSPPLAA
jgi:TolA-binding protein